MNIKIMNENQTRKAAVILSWILIVSAFLAMLFYVVKNNNIEKYTFFENVRSSAELLTYLIFIFSFPCSIRHTLPIRKTSRCLLLIPIAGWIPFAIWNIGLIMISGWFFLIADTIKMFMKKPLAPEEM